MHIILIEVFMFVYVYVGILNDGCGSVSHKFGILVSGCIHKHVNYNQILIHLMCDYFIYDHNSVHLRMLIHTNMIT
jgi:hypothetical protein